MAVRIGPDPTAAGSVMYRITGKKRHYGGATMAFGLISTLEFTVFTLLWITGVLPLSADLPAGRTGFVAVNVVATLLLATGVAVHVMRPRLARPVVLGGTAGVVAVAAWLIVNVLGAPPAAGFTWVVGFLFLLFVALFATGMVRKALGPTGAGGRADLW